MPLSPSEAFGLAVRQLRVEREISQEQAALASDNRAYFGHIERGTKSPTLKTVWKVADALEVQPSELLARAELILDS